ncbi:MAG: serine/threonine protein kinase [Gemmatimonadaceae bacterium]|nr:serine/threonine protein kinase [Gemmatimonadaceae bacterium]
MDQLANLRSTVGHRFSIERALGQGGMGTVYLARDKQLDRHVALKVLPAEFAQQHDLRERFLRETRTAAGFSHPNIVPVFSIEAHGDLLAYSMGLVEGETLAELVTRTGPMSVRDVVRVLQDVGYALAYAHGRGVVHRDIKPDNIMIERATGRALLMDFGISRSVQAAPAEPSGATGALTRVGEVVGTPEFMSPEQASGDTLDGRSDLYSLGLVAWFALTGSSAMRGESTHKVLVKQLTEPVPPVASHRPDVPPTLADVVDRCVRKDPTERFASAEALVDALDSAALRGVEIPLPIRLFAQELAQVSLVVGFIAMLLPLGYAVQTMRGAGNLDVILPLVLVAAIVWGRLAQTVQQARRLFSRGFTIDAVQNGFAALRAERDAERAQLRAIPAVIARRRKQIVLFAALILVSFALRQWVIDTMRTETSPGWFAVSMPGVIILYCVYIMRGISIVGLIRSPLRPTIGERLFGLAWGTPIGAGILRLMSIGVRAPNTVGVTVPVSAPAPRIEAAPTTPSAPVSTLESRVAALEEWRRQTEDR